MKLSLSLGQIDIALGLPAINGENLGRISAEAEQRGSDWLILPELWSTGYDLVNAPRHASTLDQGSFALMSQLAKKHHLELIGSALGVAEGHFYNRLAWFSADGSLLTHYDKQHLFGLMNEHDYLTAGDAPKIAETRWGKVGLSICYDLRFPELFRHYVNAGATISIVVAEWPTARLAHWQTLLRARAIENQQYVIACNRVGSDASTTFGGHSCIIDPWGETVIEGDSAESLLTATIDLAYVEEIRHRLPALQDQR